MKVAKLKASGPQFQLLLKSSNVQAAVMILRPGGSSSERVENEHPGAEQWLFVVSGSGRATVGRRKAKISTGTLLLIEKRERHKITNTEPRALVTLNFYCPPAYALDENVLRSVAQP